MTPDVDNDTSVHLAAEVGHLDAVDVLLDADGAERLANEGAAVTVIAVTE